jgi:hypothetical protein
MPRWYAVSATARVYTEVWAESEEEAKQTVTSWRPVEWDVDQDVDVTNVEPLGEQEADEEGESEHGS